jgi:hypothetical protein
MKNKYISKSFLIGFLSLAGFACEDLADPLVEELEVSRAFSPTELTARIRNLTTIELDWKPRADAAHYIVEYSEDSLAFTNIVRTITVAPDALPVKEVFDGQTRYSARVKAVSAAGVEDSKWTAVTIMTELENIFLPIQDGDIGAVAATLRWPANSDVTHVKIAPGNTERQITAEEKTAGVATVTGLTGETDYTVTLFKGTKQRGQIKFKTLIDIGDATAVHPEDDLSAMIAAAASGDVLVLFPGEYLVNAGAIITLNKSIAIKGLYPNNKPILHVQFAMIAGATDVTVTDVDLDGTFTPQGGVPTVIDHAFQYNASGTYGTLMVSGSTIHDYGKSLVTGQLASGSAAAQITEINFDNCVVTNIQTISADFIDFRASYVAKLSLTNSTFNTCAVGRDFIRFDAAAGLTGTGKTSTVLIDHCTLYGVSNNLTGTRRLTYVRFNANAITVKNSIIAQSTGIYTNQASTTQPVCANNNYFNAQRFYDATVEVIAGLKVDNSGTHKTLDPGFTNAAGGDFTVSNQTLKDNQVGDPRWRQ